MKKLFVLSSVLVLVLFCLQLAIPVTALAAKKKVIIGYSGKPDKQDEDKILKKNGKVKYRYSIIQAIAAEVDEEEIDNIKKDSKVKSVEPDYMLFPDLTPNDPRYGDLWGMHNTGQSGGTPDADINAPEAWDITTGDSVLIAVIDTGAYIDHEDLVGNIWTNPDETLDGVDNDRNGYIDDVDGWDFYYNDNTVFDSSTYDDHATHVAGTIAGLGNNGTGVVGVNRQAQIMVLKFLGPPGGYTSDAIAAIQYARDKGARVINASWGGGGFSPDLRDAIQNSGALFVAAAGNNGRDTDAVPYYPANYSLANIISVAATDRNDQLASFSNRGATSVDLGAPGVSILSTTPNNTYSYFNGTSMATPHVSGVAALILSQSPGLNPVEVKDQILSSVDPIPALAGITVTEGRLNAANALGATAAPPPPSDVIFEDSFEVGEWNGNWVEDGQNDWKRSTQRERDGSYSAEVDGGATNATLTMANPIDLFGKASATLTFSWFIESGWDGGEYIALDFYDGSWHEFKALRGNVDTEHVWHDETIDLGGYLVSNFKIRFRATVSSSKEDGFVDNVRITGSGESLLLPPVADFSGSPTSGVAPLTVNFTDLSTGGPTSWSWTFGDGGSSTDQDPSYTYNTPGTYTVSLTAANGSGSDSKTEVGYITVTGPLPLADFVGSPTSGFPSLTVYFTDQSTEEPTSWSWDFGDGIGSTSTAQNPSYTYTDPGTYTVSLTTTNANGSDNETKFGYITVNDPTPAADFVGSPLIGFAPLAVNFTDSSTGDIAGWSWDFGDGIGSTSSEQDPSYTYNDPGTYTVSLTVSGPGGGPDTDTEVKTNYITVLDESSVPEMYVADITPSTQYKVNKRWNVTAIVEIREFDGPLVDGPLIEGATVYGIWSGGYTGIVSGQTGSNGTVSFGTGWTKNKNSITFIVTNVEKPGWDYNPTLNNVTEVTVDY
ncbi:S8 family serine peptidase [Candidatus Poribacteria bacterium]